MDKVLQAILDAKCPEDVFGQLTGSAEKKRHALKTVYRQLVQVVHPDHHSDKNRATEAFTRLTAAYAEAEKKISADTYGDGKAAVEPPKTVPIVVQVKRRKYAIGKMRCSGDIADLYDCTWDDGAQSRQAVFKIARNLGDNDLMENEAKTLRHVFKETDPRAEKLLQLLPELVDDFVMRDAKGSARRVNVFQCYDEHISLERIIHAFPNGVDYKDAAWMLKRTMSALSVAHSAGVVHGAVLPSHILVHPTNHGAVLLDWTGAARGDACVPFVSKTWRQCYAPEILSKRKPSPATDIFMAAKSMVMLLGGNPVTMTTPDAVPKKIQLFLRGCAIDAPHARPDDAWKLHNEFDELMCQLVGKRRYRPFAMPKPS